MNIKFYQVVDTVHGTIYYTKLEREIINTPFFNRLHDVNQSSTVYLTFPPNRTKRYEHSLGTMQLTSEVFYNAAMNSSGDAAMNLLMEKAKESFMEVVTYIKNGGRKEKFIFPFQQKTYKTMDFLKSKSNEYIVTIIDEKFSTLFHGNCLLNYAPNGLNTGYSAFIFLCLLQSLRIVGLLHDIGHPPQSHIIEAVLEEIDYELRGYPEEKRTLRQKKFLSILSSYKDIKDRSIVQIDAEMAVKTKNAKKEHLHEMIGVQIMKQIIDYVFPKLMENDIKDSRSDVDIIYLLYYCTIIEFVFAIVRNKNDFWIGLHSIIDGTIDTDRLDFVPRDSQNSGMIWGKVPYKRLINTAKFGIVVREGFEDSVYVCFLDKNVQQMDDLLNNRYKIFTMINYHHRSTKIAALYQKAVKILAMEYLSSSDPDTEEISYFSDISGLWRTIEIAYSGETSVLNLIQWNDSWLNGLLYRQMIEESKCESGNANLRQCCEYLSEIFLNKHHHYSLIKRQTEMIEINEEVMSSISTMIDKIGDELVAVQKELMDGQRKIEENKQSGKKTQNATINKLSKKQEAFDFLVSVYDALYMFDWPTIEMSLGSTIVQDAIEKVMSNHKDLISSYIVEKVKFSLGTGNAYVCDYEGNVESYYKYSNIKDVLAEARLGFPFYYIYIKGDDSKAIDAVLLSDLRKEIGREIGGIINERIEGCIDFDATTRKAQQKR